MNRKRWLGVVFGVCAAFAVACTEGDRGERSTAMDEGKPSDVQQQQPQQQQPQQQAEEAERGAPDQVAEMAGGHAIPAGQYTLTFPYNWKSTIAFISDAEELIPGIVEMGRNDEIGEINVDTETGEAHGAFRIFVADMRTGNTLRDEHMAGDGWLDAELHPTIELRNIVATRESPTVWRAKGTFVMHGIERPMETLLNVRHYEKFPAGGDATMEAFRVHGKFPIDITAHNVNNAMVGGPMVAKVWHVEITLWGKRK